MKQNEIIGLPKLDNENYENIFSVNSDTDGYYFYNLLQTIQLPSDLPAGYYATYDIEYGDTWPFISYKAYNTPNLWWVIALTNNIDNPTKQPTPGSSIRLLKLDIVKTILSQIVIQQ